MTTAADSPTLRHTHWDAIGVVVASGIVTAIQVGKAAIGDRVRRRRSMERLFDHLYAVGAETLSFAPTFRGRAFLLRRKEGNILIYSSGRMKKEADGLLAQGEISRQYVNHRHQGGGQDES